MKKCKAIFVFCMIAIILTSCSKKENDFETAKEYAIQALSAVQDYMSGDMSYSGAQEKVDKAYKDVEALKSKDSAVVMIGSNLFLLGAEMTLADPDYSLGNEIVSVFEAWDNLAQSCGVDELYGTSEKRQYIEELEEQKQEYYDNVDSKSFELGTAEVLVYSYRENKGDPVKASVYIFYSLSLEKYVWSLASSMAAWASTEYQKFDIQIVYNGEDIGRFEFYDESKIEKIKTGSFSDDILGNASKMELSAEYTESYNQIDSISMADSVKEIIYRVLIKLR